MKPNQLVRASMRPILSCAIAVALCLAVTPAQAQTVHVVAGPTSFADAQSNLSDGDKVVLIAPGVTYTGPFNVVGLSDITNVAANHSAFVGSESVGIGGIGLS